MSGDSIDLEGLERKDRSELATIATVLGGKPTSRARKADLVQMILDLAGIGDGETEAEGNSGEDAQADQVQEASGGDQQDSESAEPTSAGGSARNGDAKPENSSAAEGSDPQASERGGRNGSGNDSGAENGSGPADSRRGARAEESRSSESQAEVRGEASGQPHEGNNEGQPQEGEGRKRRRRRGRDRDRNEEGDGQSQWEGEPIEVAGTLDLRDEGYGFLRVNGVMPSRDDVYVSVKQTRQFGLRRGDWLTGTSRPANRGEKNPALLRIDTVNGGDPERSRERPRFEELTPVFPNEQLVLEREDHPYEVTSRIIDLLAPIGKGQRGLIVSPPKAGKTTVMKTIAQAIEQNHPEVELIVLLIDERPEEVTDMRRSVEGAVVASTFDRPPEEHTQVVELVIERAKRMVEQGQDVVVILDGITRLARAYNLAAPAGGRIMSGGLDTGALYPPKRFFGAARNIEEGGSLTILATALVDTNSKMDEVIFEEFKGTGNMELRLDRDAAERRVFPAIDISGSSTRHEELLLDHDRLQLVWKLRRVLGALSVDGDESAALDMVIDRMRKFPTNDSFLAEIAKSPAVR